MLYFGDDFVVVIECDYVLVQLLSCFLWPKATINSKYADYPVNIKSRSLFPYTTDVNRCLSDFIIDLREKIVRWKIRQTWSCFITPGLKIYFAWIKSQRTENANTRSLVSVLTVLLLFLFCSLWFVICNPEIWRRVIWSLIRTYSFYPRVVLQSNLLLSNNF